MGTSKSGRYLGTSGSRLSPSAYAIVHSNEGTFTKKTKGSSGIRLKGGGHGQDGMNLLDKYKIKYNIVTTYANGVRIGNVPNHKNKLKRTGANQTWFPASWTGAKIKAAAKYVAGLKKNKGAKDGQTITGTFDGVRVGVIMTNGQIGTIFPTVKQ